ncbi:MAG: hypothetical protein ACI9XJ_001863, partial [Marivirga sp.]
MRYFVKTLAIFFILLKTVTAEIQPLSSFNQAADAFLKKYVEKGKV